MSNVAVLDIGKTNVKLSAATPDGAILETVSTANVTLDGPPYRHPDLAGIEDWLFQGLPRIARRHAIGAFVACGHGSAGVLVDGSGSIMPMIDYENDVPPHVDQAYSALAGPVEERGSPIMAGAAHLARQLLWLHLEWPEAFARGRWFLGGPQYWAWRLSGVAAAELTYLAAQSHLWNIPARRFTAIVEKRGWERLIPPIRPAWDVLGPLRPDLARRLGVPGEMKVLCGIHDSSANFYRYQQAGLADLAVISTGTWIVGLSDAFAPEALARTGGMTWNADVFGRPLTGILAMGGRDFAAIAGESPELRVDARAVARLVQAGTFALPTFAFDDGPFPGSAGRGHVTAPAPTVPEERRALALLYVALLTDTCLDLMGASATTVLDGSFVKDPLYASLFGALRQGRRTLYSTDGYGTAAGAALLAGHETRTAPAKVDIRTAQPLQIPGLDDYRRRWRELAHNPPALAARKEGHS
ncbi:MAG TPA: carbohydrate kinase [Propylenella sp.]|nr:carbohydrate kinase [Propylenella sp.]